jgi:hypothetical protein
MPPPPLGTLSSDLARVNVRLILVPSDLLGRDQKVSRALEICLVPVSTSSMAKGTRAMHVEPAQRFGASSHDHVESLIADAAVARLVA